MSVCACVCVCLAACSLCQEKYPLPDMKGENGDRVADVTKGIFPAFVAIMKNKDAEQQVTLEDRLVTGKPWTFLRPLYSGIV